jgi:hypothetical protein
MTGRGVSGGLGGSAIPAEIKVDDLIGAVVFLQSSYLALTA